MNGLDKSAGKSPETRVPGTQIAAEGRRLLDFLLWFPVASNRILLRPLCRRTLLCFKGYRGHQVLEKTLATF